TENRRQELAREGLQLEDKDPKLVLLFKRSQETNVYGTFAHPNAFAGYLALILPAAVGGVWVCLRRQGFSLHTGLVLVGTLLVGVGLWLTHSRGAILGLLLVAAAVVGGGLTRERRPTKLGSPALVLLLLAGLVLAGVLAAQTSWGSQGLELARKSLDQGVDYWNATWKMIFDAEHPMHPGLGGGAGHFCRDYPP